MNYIVLQGLEIGLCIVAINQIVFPLLKRKLKNVSEAKEEHIKSKPLIT